MVLVKGSTAEELYASTLTVVGCGGFSKSQATWVAVLDPVREPAPQATRAREATTGAAPSRARLRGRFRMRLSPVQEGQRTQVVGSEHRDAGDVIRMHISKDRLSSYLMHDRDLRQRSAAPRSSRSSRSWALSRCPGISSKSAMVTTSSACGRVASRVARWYVSCLR